MRDVARRGKTLLGDNGDAILVMGVVVTLVALIVPLPPIVLDVLLTFNFSYVLLLLMVVLGLTTPLELSTFPSLLLMGTLFRLAVNVASTRLILLNGYAGTVIESFGNFVVGGHLVVGLIMFLILVVIQFVVITRGSGRISEVAARFTLDGMPGKQMAIDADLNSGMITEQEAQQRRQQIVREAEFYGAMDGAAKYVRGDAVAGIIIVAINIVGGIIMGYTRGLTIGQAVKTYCLLTVGDGLVTQIPAVIMSTTAGILVTKTQTDEGLGAELGRQVFGNRRAVGMASLVVLGFGLVPGLPIIPFAVISLGLAGVYAAMGGTMRQEPLEAEVSIEQMRQTRQQEEKQIRSLLEADRVAVEVGYNLIQLIDPRRGGTLLDRIKAIRKQFARQIGIVVPKIRILDNVALETNSYVIKLMGYKVAEGKLHPGCLMVMNPGGKPKGVRGIDDKDPSFGIPVVWVAPVEKDAAQMKGYTVVDAESVFITHLSEVLRKHAHEILNRQDVRSMLDELKERNAAVVDELIPDVVSVGQVQQVLEGLLAEGVPVNNLSYILEQLGNYGHLIKDLALVTELVRKSLARAICQKFADSDGEINALSLDPRLEEELRESIQRTNGEVRLALSPQRLRQIIAVISEQTRNAFRAGAETVVLTDSQIRPYVRNIIARVFPDVPVISYDEIADGVRVNSVGVISVQEPAVPTPA